MMTFKEAYEANKTKTVFRIGKKTKDRYEYKAGTMKDHKWGVISATATDWQVAGPTKETFECSWSRGSTGTGAIRPIGDLMKSLLLKFVGKKTRVTVEVID